MGRKVEIRHVLALGSSRAVIVPVHFARLCEFVPGAAIQITMREGKEIVLKNVDRRLREEA